MRVQRSTVAAVLSAAMIVVGAAAPAAAEPLADGGEMLTAAEVDVVDALLYERALVVTESFITGEDVEDRVAEIDRRIVEAGGEFLTTGEVQVLFPEAVTDRALADAGLASPGIAPRVPVPNSVNNQWVSTRQTVHMNGVSHNVQRLTATPRPGAVRSNLRSSGSRVVALHNSVWRASGNALLAVASGAVGGISTGPAWP